MAYKFNIINLDYSIEQFEEVVDAAPVVGNAIKRTSDSRYFIVTNVVANETDTFLVSYAVPTGNLIPTIDYPVP